MPDLSGLEGLTGRGGDINAKVDYLRNILPEYLLEEYSYAQALQDLRANDFKISTNVFYDVRRQIEGLFGTVTSIRNLPNDYYPSTSSLGQNPDRQDMQYKFVYTATFEDQETGELYYQNFSRQFDSFGSVGELKSLGMQYMAEQYPQMAEEFRSIDLSYGLIKTI